MQNKDSLLHIVARAERGALLPGEAQILREAVELLDDMAMTLDILMKIDTLMKRAGESMERPAWYDASTTQSFRAIKPEPFGASHEWHAMDDDAPGRP
jgi:hypothetical protein